MFFLMRDIVNGPFLCDAWNWHSPNVDSQKWNICLKTSSYFINGASDTDSVSQSNKALLTNVSVTSEDCQIIFNKFIVDKVEIWKETYALADSSFHPFIHSSFFCFLTIWALFYSQIMHFQIFLPNLVKIWLS